MKIWVLFVWFSTQTPAAAWSYTSQAECEEQRAVYARSVCVLVTVPVPYPYPSRHMLTPQQHKR